ncbi:MAG TPA: hypothetical protein DDZ88_13960 [Verrucomicrobiales bacterium]|nr:hypothetical protein [Verrucomicrobiales bacterium]
MELDIKPLSDSNEIEIHVTFRLPRGGDLEGSTSFLQIEAALAQKLNEIGSDTTKHLLGDHDSKGESLQCAEGQVWTSKGRAKRIIETAYGPVLVFCHVYQTSAGGVTRVPLAERARLVGSATPRMARMVAAKLAQMNCSAVARDMEESHLRPMSPSFAQDLGQAVAALATVRCDLPEWRPLSQCSEVATVSVGLDGAHLNTRRDGWRQGMAGTIALYDAKGERLETLYVGGGPGETPPAGKTTFLSRLDELTLRVRECYPQAQVVGLSDGAVDLQKYLASHTDDYLLDFHHAAEHLSRAALAFAPDGRADAPEALAWAAEQRRVLRDVSGGAWQVLALLRERLRPNGKGAKNRSEGKAGSKRAALSKAARAAVLSVETYFSNHISHMDYAGWQQRQLPIGSGVTEAACKTLIKQRLCQSGMRWSIAASDALITLRALYLTPTLWDHFWTQNDKPSPACL